MSIWKDPTEQVRYAAPNPPPPKPKGLHGWDQLSFEYLPLAE
jgi:hypothetical protein